MTPAPATVSLPPSRAKHLRGKAERRSRETIEAPSIELVFERLTVRATGGVTPAQVAQCIAIHLRSARGGL